MHERKTITGNSVDEIWSQIQPDLHEELLEYNVLIRHGKREITLDIDIDLGGGFEGGYAETAMVSPLNEEDFKFAIHRQGIGDQIGKFFGMQDVVIGYPEFDDKFVIKTNNEQRVKELFSDPGIRSVFSSFPHHFTLGTTAHDHRKVLEFSTNVGVTDAPLLRNIYNAFVGVLHKLDNGVQSTFSGVEQTLV